MPVADYIDKNILCQAYVHVDLPEGMSPERLEELRVHLEDYATQRAKFFVYQDVVVDVVFRDGSLKAYITIAGAIYLAIGQYGSFRSGADCLYTDVKRLGDSIVAESLFVTRSKYNQIRWTEARVGVIGSLKQLNDDLTLLQNSLGQISVDETARRIKRIREDAERLIENVRDPKDQEALEDEMNRFVGSLPDHCPYPKDKVPDNSAVILYQDSLAEVRRRFGAKGRTGGHNPSVQ